MFTDTAYLLQNKNTSASCEKKQKPGTLLSHSGSEKVPGFVRDRFRELFCGSSVVDVVK